ncbi:hypothetical protein [Methylobacterium sp. 391_Methyba4]|uniref:hypothetical protein n=1 Tax=Methylobacterium sp. 391_Methyba4 TaxID=3038924 RepID=UPI00241C5F35|nr:hypothetical protein [Methylobacterium sp. 391_Methyba4]WFS09712.1 hypothetical protein P9K36_10725 [Methylobacterium sp. 391_Methyba4]
MPTALRFAPRTAHRRRDPRPMRIPMFDPQNPEFARVISGIAGASDQPPILLASPHTPPYPSTASRKISLRSKGSSRGELVIPDELRRILFESSLEKGGGLWMLTYPGLVRLDDQPPAVPIVHPDGRPGWHTFDFRAHFDDGRRIGISVKDEAHAIKNDVAGFLQHIAPQIPKSFADGVMLYTERSISPAMLSNARLIQAVRRDPPHPADAVVGAIVATIQGQVRIGAIVADSGHGAAAFRAVVRLIAKRVIRLTADERIGYATRVTLARRNDGEVA